MREDRRLLLDWTTKVNKNSAGPGSQAQVSTRSSSQWAEVNQLLFNPQYNHSDMDNIERR